MEYRKLLRKMPRKRLAPVRFINDGVPTPYVQSYQYEYFPPGCYYIPQIEQEVTPYANTYTHHWMPYCNTATYVVDRYGRANYLSDLEYQLEVPTVPLPQPQPREMIYHFYNDGEVELSSLPQIEEEDFDDIPEVCILRKRKRLNSPDRSANIAPLVDVPKNQSEDLPRTKDDNNTSTNNNNNNYIYRSNEGYLVEEPNDSVPDNN